MLPYQISMYCENAMYAQNTMKAKRSLPMSCECSRVTARVITPPRCSTHTNTGSSANTPTMAPEK